MSSSVAGTLCSDLSGEAPFKCSCDTVLLIVQSTAAIVADKVVGLVAVRPSPLAVVAVAAPHELAFAGPVAGGVAGADAEAQNCTPVAAEAFLLL